MNQKLYREGISYTNQSFRNSSPEPGDYLGCIFEGCDFSDSDLSEISFLECEFRNCELTLAKLTGTSFGETLFTGCKLLGLRFEDCNKLMISFRFDGCNLEIASFTEMNLKGISFRNSKLSETDFTGADLTGAHFLKCDLQNTIFRNSCLEEADFRTSFNYSIHPARNNIRKAKFSLAGLPGLLDSYDIEIDI